MLTVSVIVCAYNYARFLPQCLASLEAQRRPPDEVILVDDGSTDTTPEVAASFRSVRYVRQENSGKAAAFNRGFAETTGEIICHLDADDYWLPEKLAAVLDAFDRDAGGGVAHDTVSIDAEGTFLPSGGEQPGSACAMPKTLALHEMLAGCFLYPPPNVARKSFGTPNTVSVRRRDVEDLLPLPVDLGLAVDGALVLAAARRGLLVMPRRLSTYRAHGANSYMHRPESGRFQLRLYQWFRSRARLGESESRLLDALVRERRAQWAMRRGEPRLAGALDAVALVCGLVRLRMTPHWKHLALPIGCLLGRGPSGLAPLETA